MTPQEFLTLPDADDVEADPLERMAEALEHIAANLGGLPVGGPTVELTADSWVDEQRADLVAEVGTYLEQIATVRALIKPSTSKLANAIRAVIDPQALAIAESEPSDASQVSTEAPDMPAHDADVHEWRDFALVMAGPGDVTDWNAMNRSQIRTALGIAQPASDEK